MNLMPAYCSEWKPNSKNEAFWREVLEGRRIVEVIFDDRDAIAALRLDSGEQVFLSSEGPRLYIKTEAVLDADGEVSDENPL